MKVDLLRWLSSDRQKKLKSKSKSFGRFRSDKKPPSQSELMDHWPQPIQYAQTIPMPLVENMDSRFPRREASPDLPAQARNDQWGVGEDGGHVQRQHQPQGLPQLWGSSYELHGNSRALPPDSSLHRQPPPQEMSGSPRVLTSETFQDAPRSDLGHRSQPSPQERSGGSGDVEYEAVEDTTSLPIQSNDGPTRDKAPPDDSGSVDAEGPTQSHANDQVITVVKHSTASDHTPSVVSDITNSGYGPRKQEGHQYREHHHEAPNQSPKRRPVEPINDTRLARSTNTQDRGRPPTSRSNRHQAPIYANDQRALDPRPRRVDSTQSDLRSDSRTGRRASITSGSWFRKFVGDSSSRETSPGRISKIHPRAPFPESTVSTDYWTNIEHRTKALLADYRDHPVKGADTWLETFLKWTPRALEARDVELRRRREAIDNLQEQLRREKGEVARRRKDCDYLLKEKEEDEKRIQRQESQIKALRRERDDRDDYINTLKGQEASLLSSMGQLEQSLADEKSRVAQLREEMHQKGREHRDEVEALKMSWSEERKGRERDKKSHNDQLAALRATLEDQMAQEARKSKQVNLKLKQIIASHSGESYRPTADDAFRTSFQTLAQTIRNLVGLVPSPDTLALDQDAELDPTRFLARSMNWTGAGRNSAWPRLFQSICWRLLAKGFLHDQPGFGALGAQGEGYDSLRSMRELFMQGRSQGFSSGQHLGGDKESNEWRATLFTALLKEVRTSSSTAQEEKRLPSLFHKNVEAVAHDLVESLQRASGGKLEPRASTRMRALAHDMGILALEMGAQRAYVVLDLCKPNKKIRCGPGARFNSEGAEEGRGGAGAEVTVDITTQPCLRKIGDGREDTRSESLIVKGEIVAYA